MNVVELNLGPYNACIDILGTASPSYPLLECEDSIVLVASEIGPPLRIIYTGDDMVTVPMLTVGMAIHKDTPANRLELIHSVELKILHTLYDMARRASFELRLSQITIPIKSVVFTVNENDRLSIKAEFGICFFDDAIVVG